MTQRVLPLIAKQVLSTLAYHSIFDYPLTIEELHQFFISDRPVTLKTLKRVVNDLIKQKNIYSRDAFLYLKSLSQPSLRHKRTHVSYAKLLIARRAADLIGQLPWVKMVAVTGALAMDNTDEQDDIDLMIVTTKNRLWVIRPLVMLLVSLFFKRRRPNWSSGAHLPNLTNLLCLNLWLDETALEIPKLQQNLYTAHELAQMKQIVNKDKTYERMMTLNMWGETYLANVWKRFKGLKAKRLGESKHVAFHPFNLLNLLSFSLQLWYMRPHMTTERVNLHSAFFHPENRTDTILSSYDRLCHWYF